MNRVVTGGLAAVIVAAGGFAGGVQVQKNRGTAGGGSGTRTAATGFPGGGAPPGQQVASDAAATGTVSYTKGSVLYVKDADGNTVKVKLKSSADVTRTAEADGDKIQPGDQVVVQGAANKNGTVTATAITASEAG